MLEQLLICTSANFFRVTYELILVSQNKYMLTFFSNK